MPIDTHELNKRINLDILTAQDTTLKKSGAESFGPCPFCGGTDRFHVKSADNIWLCRHCTEGKWSDAIDYAMRRLDCSFVEVARKYLGNDAPKMSPQVIAQREAQRKAEQVRRESILAARLSEFTEKELWHELNRRMGEKQRQQWRLWGIPDSWQDYLELGYKPVYSQSIPTPAYSIPYFHHDPASPKNKKLLTIQYRLTDAPNPNDRYRFEAGLPAAYYEVVPTLPPGDIAVVCEGAKKAAVFQIHIAPANNCNVYALPSKSAHCGLPAQLRERGKVYIILDPDAEHEAQKLRSAIGKNARVVRLHTKLDDGILESGISKDILRAAFRWSERER